MSAEVTPTTFQKSGNTVIGSGYQKSQSSRMGLYRPVSTRRHRRRTAYFAKASTSTRFQIARLPGSLPTRAMGSSSMVRRSFEVRFAANRGGYTMIYSTSRPTSNRARMSWRCMSSIMACRNPVGCRLRRT